MDGKKLTKEDLAIFAQNYLGGVQSFTYNLLRSDKNNYFNKTTILSDLKESTNTRLFTKWDIGEVQIIHYSENDNPLKVSEKFEASVPNTDGIVITSFKEELQSLDLYRKDRRTVFFIAHDEGYITNAVRNHFLIDVFIAHNKAIYKELVRQIPDRSESVFFLPYGVELSNLKRRPNAKAPLKILFLARFHKTKGVSDLFEIDRVLKAQNIDVEFTLIGDGPEKDKIEEKIKELSNFRSYRVDSNEDLYSHICKNDIFILPSRLDGVPVAMLESMSCGLVPVISEFNAGISEVVLPSTGFVLPVGDNYAFAEIIKKLDSDRDLLEKLSNNVIAHIVENYSRQKTFDKYYDLFRDHKKFYRVKPLSPFKVNILDRLNVPMRIRRKIQSVLKRIA